MSAAVITKPVGQPPRANRGAFDNRETERWFEDVYRYLQGSHDTTKTIVKEITAINTSSGGSGSGSGGTTIIEEKSKRYLRWLGM